MRTVKYKTKTFPAGFVIATASIDIADSLKILSPYVPNPRTKQQLLL